MMHVKVLGMAALVAGGLGLATAANAAPFAAAPIEAFEGDAPIVQVRDGCGWGAHRNIYGECRYDQPPRPRYYGGYGGGYYGGGYGYYRPRPVYRPYGFYGPRPFF